MTTNRFFEFLDEVRTGLQEFYITLLRGDITPTDPNFMDSIHMYSSLIDNILHAWYGDPDVEKALQDDYFLYSFSTLNILIRTLDTNSNRIQCRVIRRTRRKAGGKENRRPPPSAQCIW